MNNKFIMLLAGWAVKFCLLREGSKCSSASLWWLLSWAVASTRPLETFPTTQPVSSWPLSASSPLALPGPGVPWDGWSPLNSTTLRPEAPDRPSLSASTSSSPSSLARPTSPCFASKISSLHFAIHPCCVAICALGTSTCPGCIHFSAVVPLLPDCANRCS